MFLHPRNTQYRIPWRYICLAQAGALMAAVAEGLFLAQTAGAPPVAFAFLYIYENGDFCAITGSAIGLFLLPLLVICRCQPAGNCLCEPAGY